MRKIVNPLVIIPTYNERDNLSRLIPEILGTNPSLHILVVDDGSPDNTGRAVLDLKEDSYGPRLDLKTRPGKLGYGSACIQGFKWGLAGGYDFFIQMDADWSHQPKYLQAMLRLAEGADFVVGSRYVPHGGILNWGMGRRLLSKFGNFYARFLLGVDLADFTSGFNGWSGDVLQRINLDAIRSNGYSFLIELKYRAHQLGFRHVEFPIIFEERRAGKSKMSAAIALEACWRVWALRWKKAPRARRPATS